MKLYSGIICVIIGAIILILSYFLGGVDYNWVQILGVLTVLGGIVWHGFVHYKKPKYNA